MKKKHNSVLDSKSLSLLRTLKNYGFTDRQICQALKISPLLLAKWKKKLAKPK